VTTTPFPERMHGQAVSTHTRRAKAALLSMTEKAEYMLKALEKGTAGPESAREFAELAYRLGVHLSALEALRETREWDEAEAAVTAIHAGRAIDVRNNIPAGEQQ
jgi:hypothetical protein